MAPGDNRKADPHKGSQIPEKQLGSIETYFHRIHNELSGGPAVLCISARIAGPLDIQLVKQSCRRLWERHPLLRARISVKENGPYFIFDVPCNRIPIHSVFELGKTDIRTFVERETDLAFDSTRHLWKVLLITDKVKLDKHYLIVCTHRSISDPLCTVNLAREMIAGCVEILSGRAADVDLLPVCPNFEEIAASIPESLFSEKSIDRVGQGKMIGQIPCHEPAPVIRRHTRIRSHTIEPARLKELQTLCSSEKATMRGTLAAVTVMALQQQLKDNPLIEIQTPCSIRKFGTLEIGEDEIRSLTYNAHIRPENITDRASFWKCARDYETALLRSAPDKDRQVSASPVAEDLKANPVLPLSCSLLYANEIGPIQGSPFTIENFLFVSGRRSASQFMFISAMPVHGSLPVTYAYTSPLLDEVWVDRFIKNFVQIIDKIIK
ncbi:MAG: hypothetical protein H6Q52_894 [Deltaproteobacteria bacterium]|nr:hypothetical protein [Deltaproteobacteria bacterium]